MRNRWHRERRIFDVQPLSHSFRRYLWWPLRGIWWSNRSVLLLMLALLLFLAFYALVIYDAGGLEGLGKWFNEMVNTFVSALAALIFGFVLFRLQSDVTAREKKQEMMKLLGSELSDLLQRLQENRHSNRPGIYQPKPKESEIPLEVLEPENHESHFPFRFLHPRFLEHAYESNLFGGWLNTYLGNLLKDIHEYNEQAAHLRALAVAYDGSEEMRARYRQQARAVLRKERTVAKNTRSVLNRLDSEQEQ